MAQMDALPSSVSAFLSASNGHCPTQPTMIGMTVLSNFLSRLGYSPEPRSIILPQYTRPDCPSSHPRRVVRFWIAVLWHSNKSSWPLPESGVITIPRRRDTLPGRAVQGGAPCQWLIPSISGAGCLERVSAHHRQLTQLMKEMPASLAPQESGWKAILLERIHP